MTGDTQRLYSSIKPSLKRHLLFRGSLLAALGFLPILLGGTFLPVELLNRFGLWIFFGGMALIAWGLIPYRKITKLENHPHILDVSGDALALTLGGDLALTIPQASIQRLLYVERKREYGIGVILKDPVPEKVILHQKKMGQCLGPHVKGRFGADILLPYFTDRALSKISL